MTLLTVVRDSFRKWCWKWRLWWHGIGYESQGVIGDDRSLVTEDAATQVRYLVTYSMLSTSVDWVKDNVFKGHSDEDAFEIVTEDERARGILTEELFNRRRDRQFAFDLNLHVILEGLLREAIAGTEAYAEIQFVKGDDGFTRLENIMWLRAEAVEPGSRGYTVYPARMVDGGASSDPPYHVPSWLMVDVLADLPALSMNDQTELIEGHFEEHIAQYDSLNGFRLQAEPELKGARWDAVRLRRGSPVTKINLLSARASEIVGESLLHRSMYFVEQPVFTRYFLLWQHREALVRLRRLRAAMMSVVNDRIVRVLVDANSLGSAKLVAREYRTEDEEWWLYDAALTSLSEPLDFYRETLLPANG